MLDDMSLADHIVVSGCGSREKSHVMEVLRQVRGVNPEAPLLHAEHGLASLDLLKAKHSSDPITPTSLFSDAAFLPRGCRAPRGGIAPQRQRRYQCAALR